MRQKRRYLIGPVVACALVLGTSGHAAEETVKLTFDPQDLSYRAYKGYQIVQLKGGQLPEDVPGTPWLPAKYVNVLLPRGAQVTDVRAEATEVLVKEDIRVCPVQPPRVLSRPPGPFVQPDERAYSSTKKSPAWAVERGKPHRMRCYEFVSVRVNPVRYLPAKQQLYLAKELSLTVVFTEGRALSWQAISPKNDAVFEEAVRGLVANPPKRRATPAAAAEGPVAPTDEHAGTCDYLVITNDDLAAAFEKLATHRHGHDRFSVEVKTVADIDEHYAGSDAQARIRACITDYVNNKGTLYVVLGGDNSVVPDRDCYVRCGGYVERNMPTDLYYAALSGSWDGDGDGIYGEAVDDGVSVDMAPDVLVGRIPVRDATQAINYINKVIDFERSPPDLAFSGKMIVLGDKLWNTFSGNDRPTDPCDDGHVEFQAHEPVSDAEIWQRRFYRDEVRPHWTASTFSILTDTLTSWDGSTAGDYAMSSQNMTTQFNTGWLLTHMATHGNYQVWGTETGSFDTDDAMALNGLTAFVYTVACLTGGFDKAEPSLSEAFLRNGNGAALAYMGCSRYGWGMQGSAYGGPSFDYGIRFFVQLLGNGRTRLGESFAFHKADMVSSSGGNNAYRWIQFGLNLQGDPALRILVAPNTQ